MPVLGRADAPCRRLDDAAACVPGVTTAAAKISSSVVTAAGGVAHIPGLEAYKMYILQFTDIY